MILRFLLLSLVAITLTNALNNRFRWFKPKCPLVPEGTFGICLQQCDGDDSCGENEKCCSNGCGNVCKAACPIFRCPRRCPPNKSVVKYLNESSLCIYCKCSQTNPCAAATCLAPSNCIVGNGGAICVSL